MGRASTDVDAYTSKPTKTLPKPHTKDPQLTKHNITIGKKNDQTIYIKRPITKNDINTKPNWAMGHISKR